MEKDLEDLVEMVRQHPEGLSLGGLKTLFQQAYNRNLCPLALGYNSIANMVDNMVELTIIKGSNGKKKVVHKAQNASATMETEDRGIVLENIINLLMKHPNGYGLQTLPTVYRQKYKTELSFKTLGFTTVEALVESLSEHLIVIEKRVFHVMHKTPRESANPGSSVREVGASATQPQGGLPAAALSFLGPSLITPATAFNTPGPPAGAPSTVPRQAERLAKNQLLQRVMEVMKKYDLDNPPMSRLQSCYLEHFGSELPFNDYLSLYDDWEGSQRRPTATTGPDSEEAPPQGHTAFLTKTKDLKDLVKMVRKYPEGLPLANLPMFFQKTYKRSLSLHAMGFSSIESLVASQDTLLIRGTEVFHKSTAISDVPSKTAKASKEKETILENLINMVKAHPKGVRLKTLATNYSQTYSKKLCLATLGFATVELVVCSLPEHLFINGNKVFHVMHNSESEPPAAMAWWPPLPSTPSQPVGAPSAAAKPAQKPTAASQSPKASKPSTPALLPDPDFPALGAPAPTAKATSSNALVDGYHNQLRKVHRAGMRAMEALEADTDGGVARKWSQSLHPDIINDLMQDVIRDLASQGELVTREKVISRGCQLLQIPSLDSARVKPWQIPALKDLQYLIREVNMFLQASEYAYSICTLYEVRQSLAALKDKKRFEELNLGPLCKMPLVHRLFKVHANTKDDDIPHIETVDVLRQLRSFMRKSPGAKIDLADFMKHLSDHYKCESPYELGIRILSVGLPIATLSKVSRGEQALQEKAREQIQKELEEETLERLRKVKKNVLEALPHAAAFSSFAANTELRSRYASLTAAEVVLAVFSNAEGVFSPRMTKHVQDFLRQVSGDRLARALFQLSICGGSLAAPQDLVLKDKSSKAREQAKAEENNSAPLPTEAVVKQFVRDNLSSQTSLITLSHMAALEKKLAKHFNLSNFLSLEMGSFLDFLTKHIQLLQECLGSALVLSSSSSLGLGGSGLKPTRQDVFEFIKQCGDVDHNDPQELSLIDSALRTHYRLRDCRDLGFGSLQRLAALVHQQKQLSGGGLSPVHYEAALLARRDGSCVTAEGESVGRLGEMNKDQALSSLLSCPLLEDMGQWSQWDLVFKPLFGSLQDFIERNAGTTGLSAVEVTPGVLLRTTSDTGDQAFCAAAESLDPVGTAGHLVSMVVTYGLTNAPLALLANHMQSSLAAAVATQDLSQAHEDVACYRTVADFVLGCLVRIPVRTCQALMQQVFLEPFAKVLGQTRSKEVLMRAAQSNPQHMNCLHRLGILLGITDWIKDYHRKLRPPQQLHENHVSRASATQAKPNDVHSESSSELYVSDSEDPDILDSSFPSPALNLLQGSGEAKLPNAVNGDENVRVKEEEEEDDEELYELASDPSSEAPEPSSISEQEEEKEEEEAPITEDRPPVCSQQALIDDIRKSEFGVGVELTAEGQKLMQVHQERLGRSLDRLSTELYSKDTHFVLELIQNADDNSYALEDSITPALAFVVERDCITVLNNEMGFQEKNIRAICDVGRSTKGKHTYGYIGQKGIGFKSVFKVTDCPEIHSNGFHLRFDKNCGPMGYILPHWATEQRAVDPQLLGLSQHSWTTQISLPLRSESHQTRNLFHDVHPSLLLFLHRLRSIAIYNQLENRFVTMSRKDLSHNVLEVEHTDGTERWLVIKSMLKPPKIKDGVECTELALAFQLSTEETGSDVTAQPQKQPVFAYLPLRTFGFRFIIQGDFDIPSSREDVDRDSSWNQWLRSEIPLLLLQAMEVFNSHPDFQGLGGLCHFLQFTPLPDEILDFFKPVALQTIQLLKGRACLPTLGSDGTVVYKLPSQVAVCQDPVIREVIGGEELEKHLCLSYLHPALRPAPPPSLLRELGVRYLRGPDVTTVTSAMARDLIKMEGIHSEGGVRKLAKLLVCNFRALEHGYGEADSILQTLRDLPIIPLSDGRVVALSGEGVFFPMQEASSKKKASAQRTGPLSALYQDVCVVQPSLLNCMDPLESQQVRELLRRLGVHELEPQELLQQHIYPAIRSGRWKSKPEAVVVSYLVFIKQHSSSSSLLELSDTAVPVLTSRGLLCPKQSRVYFTEEYGNISLTSRLPGYDWVLLSPGYVRADSDVAGWRELFTKLGVRDGFIIRKERKTLTPKELASSPWSVESSRWTQSHSEDCVIDDYPCEEFYSLATAQLSAPLLLQQRLTLLELLVSNWDSGHRYSQYLTAQMIDSDGRVIKSTNSSFYYHLCRLEWVPAQRPLQSGQEERSFMCPSSVYLSSEEIRGLLGTHVWYVDLQPSEFSRKLGMRETVTVDSLITEHLKKWSVGAQAEEQEFESEGAEFTSTVEHIHTVYSYLNKNCPQSGLKELFQHTPAVFVLQQRHSEEWVTGRFYHLKEVCWSDPTSMFLRYKSLTQSSSSPVQNPRVLAPFYNSLEGMKDFFTRLLNVDRSPNIKQYVGLLEVVCSSSPPSSELLQDVSVLYATLAHKCKTEMTLDYDDHTQPRLNPAYCSTLKGMVSDLRVFPTKDNTWVSLSRKPMICDSRELEKVFRPHKDVCLLNLPPAEKKTALKKGRSTKPGQSVDRPAFEEEERDLFLEICGIKRLSACVQSEAQTESLRPCVSMQEMVRSVVPYIQRFLYHREDMSELYSELEENDIAERVKKLSFRQVGKLYRLYQLDVPDRDSIIEMEDVICLLKDQKELYIQKDHLGAKLDICRELVKLFCSEVSQRKELMHFLSGLITSLSEPAALKRYLQKEDIRELPEEEERWEVPEPPKPPQPDPSLDRVFSRPPLTEEPSRPPQDSGEQTLVCWPPRASSSNAGAPRKTGDGSVVEAVNKMWPPPAPPKDRVYEPGLEPRERGPLVTTNPNPSSGQENQARGGEPNIQRVHSQHPLAPTTPTGSRPSEPSHDRAQPGRESGDQTPGAPKPPSAPEHTVAPAPSAQPSESSSPLTATDPPQAADRPPLGPDAVLVSGVFQGTAAVDAPRPPLIMDFPQWTKDQFMEDMAIACQKPTTVVLSDQRDLSEIGEWGERLVHSFLLHWRDSSAPGRPSVVEWCNESGESGQPYDFKLAFSPDDSAVYVEVKSTVKAEKAFIHMSANELDFALKKKEHYHIFRVYSAGDAQNVRLCRIQNLAQHLHTKNLDLYIFV